MLLTLFTATVLARDYIFGFATGYRPDVIKPFLISARRAGFDGEIWIGIFQTDERMLRTVAQEHRARLVVVERPETQELMLYRFVTYASWATKLSGTDWILAVDLRDSFVQRNPFDRAFREQIHKPVNLFFEELGVTIGEESSNANWIKTCWGESGLRRVANNRIICAGTIMGEARAIQSIFNEMITISVSISHCSRNHGTDQAILNMMYQTNNWKTNDSVVQVWSQGSGPVTAAATRKKFPVNNFGFAINDDGSIAGLVHQYDRVPALAATYKVFLAKNYPFPSQVAKEKVAASQHYVFSMATNYATTAIAAFVRTLRLSGFTGHIIMGILPHQRVGFKEFARTFNITFRVIAATLHEGLMMNRFRIYVEWCRALNDDDWVLTADARDSVVQKNPFDDSFMRDIKAPVNLFFEGTRTTIGREGTNAAWVRQCFGAPGLRAIAHNTIICGGNQFGRVGYLKRLFTDVIHIADSVPHCEMLRGTDQAIFNHMYQKYDWQHNNSIVRVWKQGTGPVNTLSHVEPRVKGEKVLNDDGTLSGLLHQYDRFDHLRRLFST